VVIKALFSCKRSWNPQFFDGTKLKYSVSAFDLCWQAAW